MAEHFSRDFGLLLHSDDAFVDYLNSFLRLKIFPKKIQFDRSLNAFVEIETSDGLENFASYDKLTLQEKTYFNRFLMKWCHELRLPYFLRSLSYREYRLCRKLIHSHRAQSCRSSDRLTMSRFSQFSLEQSSYFRDDATDFASCSLPMSRIKSEPVSPNRRVCFSADLTNTKSANIGGANSLPPLPSSRERKRPTTCNVTFRHAESLHEYIQTDQGVEEPLDEKEVSSSDDEGETVLNFDDMPENDIKADDISIELRSISTKLHMSVQELKEDYLGSISKMEEFKKFLNCTMGKNLIPLWLDIEEYKEAYARKNNLSLLEKDLRKSILRDVEEKFRTRLTDNGSTRLFDSKDEADKGMSLFQQMQKDILKCLRTYWVPRYLVHGERCIPLGSRDSSDSGRGSSCSFFPSISVVKTLPLLGNQITELPKETPFQVISTFEDVTWHDNAFTTESMCSDPDSEESGGLKRDGDTSDDLFQSDHKAGYPFYDFAKSSDKQEAVYLFQFLWEIQMFARVSKCTDSRLTRLATAWKIFNKYLAPESKDKIILEEEESKLIQETLLEAKDVKRQLPLSLFYNIKKSVEASLLDLWELYKEEDLYVFTRKNIESLTAPLKGKKTSKKSDKVSSSPGRWVKRTPGSSESERRQRLYTALSMAEEINASRQSERKNSQTKLTKKKKKKKKVKFKEDENAEQEEPAATKKKEVVHLVDFLDNKGLLNYFRQYIQNQEGRATLNNLLLLMDIGDYTDILVPKSPQRQQQAKFIYNTYFDRASRRAVELPTEILDGVQNETLSSVVIGNTKEFLVKELDKTFRTFYKAFQAYSEQKQDSAVAGKNDTSRKHHLGGKFGHAFGNKRRGRRKGSARMQPTKEDRLSFTAEAKKCSDTMTEKMWAFRKYLLWKSEVETFPRLEKDLMFYLEVQKFKELWNSMDEVMTIKKAEVIIDVFIDSSTPPWIQIDISPDLSIKIVQRAQVLLTSKRCTRDSKDSNLFDEAQSTVLKELLMYWTSFNIKYPDQPATLNIPESKFEKNTTRRYQHFLGAPHRTEAINPQIKTPSAGKSRSDMVFSYKSGLGWKKLPEEKVPFHRPLLQETQIPDGSSSDDNA